MTKFLERRQKHRAITKPIVFFYHANCTDGFSAAWAAWRTFGDSAQYVATFHEEPPPVELKDKEIYTLDITFSEPVTRELIANNIRVTAIDHHESSKAVTQSTQEALYAEDHSGATLAWQYFHPGEPVPELLLSVEDMDLWRLAREGTKELYAYLDLFDFDFATWSRLVGEFEDPEKRAAMLRTGTTLLQYESKLIERLISKDAHMVRFDGLVMHAINASSVFRNYIAIALAQSSPSGIGMAWWETGDGMIAVTLRSTGNVDVSALAAKHGGGGHPHSAGFRVASRAAIPWENIESA